MRRGIDQNIMKKSSRSSYFTRPGSLNGLEELAHSLHQPLVPMLARVGLAGTALHETGSVVPYAAVCALLETCAAEWQLPDLGIRLGRTQSLEFLGPFHRARLRSEELGGVTLTADFSANLVRDMGLEPGKSVPVGLPSERRRVFPVHS